MSRTLTPMESEQDVEKVREQAIAFYDQEHNLTSEERKQLYVFFEQQCRRMLLGFSVGVALGTAAPFIVRKRGTLVHPALPVVGAVLGGTIVPGLVNHSIYTMQVEQFNRKFGENSAICRTIAKTPDPLSKSVFWSNYFQKSSSDPNFRMKDPRTVTNSTKFFSIEDAPKIPPYGKPGYYKSDEGDRPPTMNEQYLSGWDKVRLQKSRQNDGSPSTPSAPSSSITSSTDAYGTDALGTSSGASTPRSIGDSYDSNEATFQPDFPSATPDQSGQKSSGIVQLDHDHLIQDQGASGSAWDKVRQESRRH